MLTISTAQSLCRWTTKSTRPTHRFQSHNREWFFLIRFSDFYWFHFLLSASAHESNEQIIIASMDLFAVARDILASTCIDSDSLAAKRKIRIFHSTKNHIRTIAHTSLQPTQSKWSNRHRFEIEKFEARTVANDFGLNLGRCEQRVWERETQT